jgi:glutamine synthetase
MKLNRIKLLPLALLLFTTHLGTNCHQIATKYSNCMASESCTTSNCDTEILAPHKAMRSLADVSFAEFAFTDLNGNLRSITVPAAQINAALKNGLKFDGSSVAGCTAITDSDMHLTPDKTSAMLMPKNLRTERTALVICDVGLSETEVHECDPRYILKQVTRKLAAQKLQLNVGAELEFYLVNTEDHTPFDQDNYISCSTNIETENFKQEILTTLINTGINVEKIHHEVGPGQYEVVLRYGEALKIADNIVVTKYIIQSVAQKYNLAAIFMPKPFSKVNGSGMHLHYSLQNTETQENLFYDAERINYLSDVARKFITGNLDYMSDVSVLFNPTANSYERLVPDFEAPIFICWGIKNRSALVRIPLVNCQQADAIRAELRCPDASCNPYLALAALGATGLQGLMDEHAEYPPAIKVNLYKLNSSEIKALNIQSLPRTLEEALVNFERSNFNLEVFGNKLVTEFIKTKRAELANQAEKR